jgi:hypothetical protein
MYISEQYIITICETTSLFPWKNGSPNYCVSCLYPILHSTLTCVGYARTWWSPETKLGELRLWRFSASFYFLYSVIFLPVVDTYTARFYISYTKLNIKYLCQEYFLNFLSCTTLPAPKQGILRDSPSAYFISETALFREIVYVGFTVTCFSQFSS